MLSNDFLTWTIFIDLTVTVTLTLMNITQRTSVVEGVTAVFQKTLQSNSLNGWRFHQHYLCDFCDILVLKLSQPVRISLTSTVLIYSLESFSEDNWVK